MEKDFGKGLISLDIKDKDDCPIFDPFGMCTVNDCLTCDNCDYMVILASGEVLKNFVLIVFFMITSECGRKLWLSAMRKDWLL